METQNKLITKIAKKIKRFREILDFGFKVFCKKLQQMKLSERNSFETSVLEKKLLKLKYFEEFAGLQQGNTNIQDVLKCAGYVIAKKGDHLFECSNDSVPEKVFIVIEGKVGIYRKKQGQNTVHEERNMDIVFPDSVEIEGEVQVLENVKQIGDMIGSADIIAQRSFHNTSAICLAACSLVSFSAFDFHKLLQKYETTKSAQYLQLFSSISLFDSFSKSQLNEIIDNSHSIENLRNDVLFRSGAVVDSVYFVQEGKYGVKSQQKHI